MTDKAAFHAFQVSSSTMIDLRTCSHINVFVDAIDSYHSRHRAESIMDGGQGAPPWKRWCQGKACVEESPHGDLETRPRSCSECLQDHYFGIRCVVDANGGVAYAPPALAIVSSLWLRRCGKEASFMAQPDLHHILRILGVPQGADDPSPL